MPINRGPSSAQAQIAGQAGPRTRDSPLSLIYFHRLLIFCAILFAIFFSYKGFEEWQSQDTAGPLIVAISSGAAAIGLGFYLRTVKLPTRRKDPGGPEKRA